MSAVLLGVAVAWLVFVVLHRVLTGRFWLWLLPDLIPPASYLGIPLVLLVIAVPTAQFWAAGVALVAMLIGIDHCGLNRHGFSQAGEAPLDAVRVLSWNTEYWDQAENAKHLYEFLKAGSADIYALQERLYGSHHDQREVPDLNRLRAEFPDYHLAAGGELLTLSRFPIAGTDRVGSKVLRTDLVLGTGMLSVYNVHIPAQYVRDDKLLSRHFFTQLRDRNGTRRYEFDALRADVAANPNPVLVTGDFNSTGAMGELRWLGKHLRSANYAARQLFPGSWPAGGPALWQLDWTFTRGLLVHRYELGDPRGISDHRTQELLISMGGTNHDRTQAPAEVSARADQ